MIGNNKSLHSVIRGAEKQSASMVKTLYKKATQVIRPLRSIKDRK